jgi:hypothetical protein
LDLTTAYPELGELFAERGGTTVEEGLYRIHDWPSSAVVTDLVKEAFPEVSANVGPCFGYDWLGREFGLDLSRRDDAGRYAVYMHEPGTSSVRALPATVATFHDRILVEQREAALAAAFFEEWAAATQRRHLPLGRNQCVGYKVPVFLNGKDEIDNLEVSDIEVYWSICGQLRLLAMRERRIRSLRIDD